MAITQRKEDNLVETKIVDKKIQDIKKNPDPQPKPTPKPKRRSTVKKPGFLATTWEEIKKVKWPSFDYTIRWSVIIVLFTLVMSVSLGFFDHAFTGGIRFVNCTSPQTENKSVGECSQKLLNYVIYKDTTST